MEQKNEQEQKKQPLFREKSLERISSPEQLHDYLRVTSPRLWMILGTIVALLVGFVVYASTTRMESTLTVKALVSEFGDISAGLPAGGAEVVAVGMPVRIGGQTGVIRSVDQGSYYRLQVVLESGGTMEDAGYFLLPESATLENASEAPAVYVANINGEWLADQETSDQSLLRVLQEGGELRMRFWTLDISEDMELVYRPGRLATVSGQGTAVTTLVTIRLDDPEAKLEPGTVDAEIVTESTTPISFLLN